MRPALRRDERQFRDLIENIPALAWSALSDGSNTFVSRRWTEYTGLSAEETAGWGWRAAVHPNDIDRYVEKWRASLSSGEPFEDEARIRRAADGEYRWFLARAEPLRDEQGSILAWYGMLTDIEDRKRAEQALRASEERFRMLVQFSFDVYWESDENHRFTRQEFGDGLVNAPPRGSEIGRTRWEVPYLEPDEEAWRKHRATMDAHLPFRDFELARPTPEGGKRYVSVSGVPVFDEAGRFVGYRGVGRDITQRKRAEAELRQREKELRDLVETMPAIAWTISADGSNVFASRRWTEYSGLPAEALSGSAWLAAIHPDDVDRHITKWRTSATTGVPFENEARLRRVEDGGYRWFLVRAVPLQDEHRRVLQWYGLAIDIEERKRAEQTLRQTEAYLAEAQRLSHTGTFAYDPVSRESLYWSEEVFRICGLDPQRGLPDPVEAAQLVHPDDRDRTSRVVLEAFREKAEVTIEYRLLLRDGTIKHLHVIWHPVFDKNGELIEYIGTVADVTDGKRAEEEHAAHLWFLESMDLINRAMQGTNDLAQMMSDVLEAVLEIFAGDRAWLVYPCDPEASSWRPVMEHTRPEFPGAFAMATDLPVDTEVATVFRSARAATGAVQFGPASEHPVPAQVAERFSIRSTMVMAVYPKVDQPYLFGLHQCSHARAWTAQEQRLFQEIGRRLADSLTSLLVFRSLCESEAKLEEAQRIAHVGYWEYDIDADRVTLSDEAGRIHGMEQRDLAHWQERLGELVHPDDRARVSQAFAAVVERGSRFDVECRLVYPNGALRIVQKRAHAERDESGRPRRVFGMVQDITERKHAEAERLKLEERLRQAEKLEAIGRFASGIAHDFNNVLGGITAYGEMLFDDAPENSPRKRYAQNVLTAATRGRDLVDQILAYTRSQRGKREPTDVCRTVAETIELVRSSLPASITIYATVPDAPVVVMGDPTQLHQVVMNLCSNAIHAMSDGGPLRVAITPQDVGADCALSHGTLKQGGYARLSVEDGGCGMDEAMLARIFEPFFTTKEVGRGTGLGLALVHAIVTDFGGVIDVKSVPDEGSTFSIYLPLARSVAPVLQA